MVAEIEIDSGFLKVNGKYYITDYKDGKPILVEESKRRVKLKISRANKMADVLESKLDKNKVLMESILNLSDTEFDVLYRMLFKDKKNYKVKTREGHCVDMKIGGFILPIC